MFHFRIWRSARPGAARMIHTIATACAYPKVSAIL